MNIKLTQAIRAQLFKHHSMPLSKTILPALLFCSASSAFATDHVWLGGSGTWTAGNWSNTLNFPNSTTADVFIDNGNTLNSIVNLFSNVSVGTLTIDEGDSLNLNDGFALTSILTVNAGYITNNGNLSLKGPFSHLTQLQFATDTLLTGTGITSLGNGSNRVVSSNGARTLTIDNGHTLKIEGGILGGDNTQLGGTQSLTVVNQGLVQVADGARLTLNADTLSGGILEGIGSASLGGTGLYRDLTMQGSLQVGFDTRIKVAGQLINNGTLALTGTDSHLTILQLADDTLLTGNGKTLIGNGLSNRITSLDGTKTLTIADGHTVQGGGNLGGDNAAVGGTQSLKVINQGLVKADAARGITVSVDDNNGAGFDNSAGIIEVADGSSLSLIAGTIKGGTLKGGLLEGLDSAKLGGGGIFQDLTLENNLQIGFDSKIQISGTINNNGTLALTGPESHSTLLQLADDTLLSGNGVTVLGNASANRIVSSTGSKILTIGEAQTLQIEGGILGGDNPAVADNQSLTVVNQGLVQVADGARLTLNADTLSGGILEGIGSASLGGTGLYRDLTMQGSLQVGFDTQIKVAGELINNGILALTGTDSHRTMVQLAEDTTLKGIGTTVIGNGLSNQITSLDGTKVLTIAAGHHVQGGGTLGGDNAAVGGSQSLKIINQGTIKAERGTMTLSAETLNSSGVLGVAADSALNQAAGSVTAQTINVETGGSYNLNAGRLEVTDFNGNFSQQNGVFAAGIGTGISAIDGNYSLGANGKLEFALAGKSLDSFDQLQVQGSTSLSGGLQIMLLPELFASNGYTPAAGDSFDFIVGASEISVPNSNAANLGLNFDILVSQASANLFNGLTYADWGNGMFKITDHLFDFSLVQHGTILRGTLVSGLAPTSVPVPSAMWLFASALVGFIGIGRRRNVSYKLNL